MYPHAPPTWTLHDNGFRILSFEPDSRLMRSLRDSHNLCIQKQVFVSVCLVINSKDRRSGPVYSIHSHLAPPAPLHYCRQEPLGFRMPLLPRNSKLSLFVCSNIHKFMTQERVLKIKVDPSFYSWENWESESWKLLPRFRKWILCNLCENSIPWLLPQFSFHCIILRHCNILRQYSKTILHSS